MSEQLVRDLLEANIQLTREVVELAKAMLGQPVLHPSAGAQAAAEPVTYPQPFEMTTADDWDDIPAESEPNAERRMHLSEDEEDAAFRAAHGLITPGDYSSILEQAAKEVGLMNTTVNTTD